ncbi:hypothetical protein GMORB2_2340, partial [Geosmithia morbida]
SSFPELLEKGTYGLSWEDVYDIVNPYGDHRGRAIDSMWTFDLDRNIMSITRRSTPDYPWPALDTHLPAWKTPAENVVPVGSSWAVLSQDAREGLQPVRRHIKSQLALGRPADQPVTCAILAARHVFLCRALGEDVLCTRPEVLFSESCWPGKSAAETAIDMILSNRIILEAAPGNLVAAANWDVKSVSDYPFAGWRTVRKLRSCPLKDTELRALRQSHW